MYISPLHWVEGKPRGVVAAARGDARPVESPARRMMGNVARAFGGNRAVAAQESWEEF